MQPGSLALSVLQVGLPPAVPWVILTGAELWLGAPGTANVILPDFGVSNQPLRVLLPAFILPGPGVITSMQLVCLLVTPIGPGGGCSSLWTGSPALWFAY